MYAIMRNAQFGIKSYILAITETRAKAEEFIKKYTKSNEEYGDMYLYSYEIQEVQLYL